jgi:hypothetical protein
MQGYHQGRQNRTVSAQERDFRLLHKAGEKPERNARLGADNRRRQSAVLTMYRITEQTARRLSEIPERRIRQHVAGIIHGRYCRRDTDLTRAVFDISFPARREWWADERELKVWLAFVGLPAGDVRKLVAYQRRLDRQQVERTEYGRKWMQNKRRKVEAA